MSKTITLPAKKTLSTKEFQNLKKEDDMTDGLQSTIQGDEGDAPEQKLMPVSMSTYILALQTAMVSYKYALKMEAATALSVYCSRGAADRQAKRTLLGIYAEAGWKCSSPNDREYKSVCRRIGAFGFLFNKIGATKIEEAIGGAVESQLIDAVIKLIEPMGLTSIDGILEFAGRPRLPAAKAALQQIEGEQPKQKDNEQPKGGEGPSGGTPSEGKPKGVAEETKADEGKSLEPGEIILPEETKGKAQEHTDKELPDDVEGPRWMRRAEDNPENIFKRVDTLHIHIALTKDADRTEIIAAAMKLLSIAEEMNNGHEGEIEVKGALQEELSKLEQTPLKAELRNVPEPMKKPRGRKVIR